MSEEKDAERREDGPKGRAERREDGPKGRGERREERRPSLRGLARRILGEDADRLPEGALEDDPDLDPEERARRSEARALLAAVLETGDKAKTETVRMVAREIRGYLEALELHKDLHHLLTNYSLEVKASIHLAPLDEAAKEAGPSARAGLKRKAAPAASDADGPSTEGDED